MKTLAKIHTENRAREAALIRSALEGYGWNLSRAAALLGVTYSRLRGILERGRHPELWAEYQARNPGKGRPQLHKLDCDLDLDCNCKTEKGKQ